MADDNYDKINENQDQTIEKLDNDINTAAETVESEVVEQGTSDTVLHNNDTVQSVNTEQSSDTVQNDNTEQSSDTVQNDNAEQSGNIVQNVNTEQSGDIVQNDNAEQSGATVQNDNAEQNGDIVEGSNTAKSDGTSNEGNVNFEDMSSNRNSNNIFNETQKVWQMQNIHNNMSSDLNGANRNNYYKESYKKPNKKSDAWKYILVSLVSAIVGGAIISVMILIVAPLIQPQLKSLIGEKEEVIIGSNPSSTGEVKKIEIVQSGESAVTSVAEKVGPSIVGIKTSYQSTNEFFGQQADGGEGSGIIISTNGYVLTNHHVIENALNDKTRNIRNGAKIQVYLPNKIDKPYTATIKGYDSKTDLAILKINDTDLPAIEFGDSDSLKVGETVIAFGNPGGLEYIGSVTVGVVSGLNRTVQLDGGRKIKLVQTDAAINPGNSGGALVNIKGQLVGVNSIKMVATGFEGLGFAIPSNDTKKIADELIKNTYISKPYLGITVDNSYTEDIAKANNMPMGVFVADVEILGAAQKAGIKALDVITKFNKVAVTSYDELETQKNKYKAGDTVEIELYRDGSKKTVQVTLGETK